MERKNVQWLTGIIVAVFGMCACFVAGSWMGIRERAILKAQNATLSADVMRVSERLTKAETTNEDLAGQLEHAQGEVDRQHVAAGMPEIASSRELVDSKASIPSEGAPARSSPTSTMLAESNASPATKEQCSTITQKGLRCSRFARSNGKCWQHGG